jgi:hypothetical protein
MNGHGDEGGEPQGVKSGGGDEGPARGRGRIFLILTHLNTS